MRIIPFIEFTENMLHYLPGRGILIPIEVFKKIGNFNVKMLPHYGADYEFAIRARRAGFKLIVSNKARVFAKLSISGMDVPDKKFISVRECFVLLFSKKSRKNFFYNLNYTWLCSEKQFRLKNVMRLAIIILRDTLFKTIYLYPIYRPLSIIFRFLFQGYPLNITDIERYGINSKKLIDSGMLKERQLKGIPFYYITPELELWAETLPSDKKDKLCRLRRLSFNYFHKFKILRRRIMLHLSER